MNLMKFNFVTYVVMSVMMGFLKMYYNFNEYIYRVISLKLL